MNTRHNPARTSIATLASLAMIFAQLSPWFLARAQANNTWDGGGVDNNWTTNANWGLDSAPAYGTLVFTGSVRTTSTIDAAYSMNQLNWNGSSAWVLNSSGTGALSLFDNGGTQAKLESLGTGGVTINAPVTFAATAGSNWGEINAVSSSVTFASGTLTVNGSGVAGIRLFGGTGAISTSFNSTVAAAGKYFATSNVGQTVNIGGSFTAGDFYLMNSGTLNLNSGGSLTTSIRLGGDFGTTGTQDLSKGATFALTKTTGGQSFAGILNSVASNTSNALLVDSQNTSGTNTISSSVITDSALKIQQATGGSLLFSGGSFDVKSQTLTFSGNGSTTVNEVLGSSNAAGGNLIKAGTGVLILQGTANNYTGTSNASLTSTEIQGGTLGIYGDTSLGLAPSGAFAASIKFTSSGTLQDTANNITLTTNRGITVSTGATASFDSNGNTFAIAGIITGSGGIAKTGAGAVTLTGSNTYTGNTTLNTGTLNIGNANAISSGTFVIGGNGSFDNTTGGPITISNVINMNGGSPTFIGSSSLTTTGSATMNAGRTITVNANTLTIGGGLTGGAFSFTKAGSGTLTLGAAAGYTGATLLGPAAAAGGTLIEGASNALANNTLTFSSAGSNKLVLGTATSGAVSQTFTWGNVIVSTGNTLTNSIVGGNASNSTLTLNATTNTAIHDELIGGAGTNENNLAVIIAGAGTTRYQGTTKTYTGDTTVNAGSTLSINISNALAGNGNLIANGNVDITVASSSLTVSGLSGTGTVRSVSSTTKTLNVGSNNATSQFDGTLTTTAGALNLVKTGTGTLTLTGNNSYGSTTINSGGTLQIGNNTASGTLGTGTVSNFGTLVFNRNDTGLNVGVAISGAGVLNQTGSGTTTLSGTNTYIGTTTISSGTISIVANNNLGANGAAVSLNGGTLMTTAGITDTHVITVGAGGGTLNIPFGTGGTSQLFLATANTLTGSGALAVTGGNLRAGTAQSYSGVMTLKNGGSFEYGVAGAVGAGASFIVNGTGDGVQTTSGELIVQGNPSISLPNAITSTGGILSFEYFAGTPPQGGGNYTGPITLSSGTTTVALRNWYNVATVTSGSISGIISGTGALAVNSGSGTGGVLTLTGSNSYAGTTTISASILQIGTAGSLGSGAYAGNILNSGTLQYSSSANQTLSGILSGSGALIKDTSASSTLTLSGSNSYTGATTINSGTLQIGDGSTAGASVAGSAVSTGTAGTLAVNLANGGTFSNSVSNSGAVNTIAGGTNTLSGNISGGGTFNQTGAGTTILSGSHTYTGATTVSAGTLSVAVGGSINGSTSVTVSNSAVLSVDGLVTSPVTLNNSSTLKGKGTISGLVTTSAGTTVSPGNSTDILTLSNAGGFNLVGGAHLAMEIGGTTAGGGGNSGYDRLVVSGALTIAGDLQGSLINAFSPTSATYNTGTNQLNLDGTTFYLVIGASSLSGSLSNQQAPDSNLTGFNTITFGGQQFAISYDASYNGGTGSVFSGAGGHDIALMAIPEPQTWAMLLGGFGMLLTFQRMRRRKV